MTDLEISQLPVIKINDVSPFVAKIKALLRSQGLWTGSDSEVFGPKLEQAVKYFQSTHIGKNKRYLDIDGVVGQDTWWSLYNPSGEEQRNHIQVTITDRYKNLSESRQKQLAILFQEYIAGVHEIPDGSNGGDGVEKYIANFGNAPWCALFQSWVWKESHGEWPKGTREAHVQTWWRKAVSNGYGYKINSGYKPIPGDLLIYTFGGGTGHVTAVVAVENNNYELNTVGGNEGNRVKLGYRNLKEENSVAGFINLHGDTNADFTKGLFPQPLIDELDQNTR